MKARRTQSGQALVVTLVIMVVVFAMAGAVALAAASLLDQQGSRVATVANDLRASDAMAAAVAQVAGHGTQTQPGCTEATVFSSLLPGAYTSTVNCFRLDAVAAPSVGSVALLWQGECGTAALPSSANKQVWLYFSARAAAGLTAWVDGLAGCDATAGSRAKCRVTAQGLVGQVGLACDVADVGGTARIHVSNDLASPAAVWFAQKASTQATGDGDGKGTQGNTGDSIYLLVATTGLSGGPQFEEGSVFVSHDGSTTALLAEGSL